MPPNGSAALQLLEPPAVDEAPGLPAATGIKIGAALTAAAAPAPPFDPDLGGPAAWIDPILNALVAVSVEAVWEIQGGQLTTTTKTLGGDLLGRLVMLQGRMGARDFDQAVRRTTALLDAAAIDEIISTVGRLTLVVREMN